MTGQYGEAARNRQLWVRSCAHGDLSRTVSPTEAAVEAVLVDLLAYLFGRSVIKQALVSLLRAFLIHGLFQHRVSLPLRLALNPVDLESFQTLLKSTRNSVKST